VKIFIFICCLVCALNLNTRAAHTNAVLSAEHYDLAELVFRQYISTNSTKVFCLAFGTNNAPLPSEFIARFKNQPPVIRAASDSIIVISNKYVLDKVTRKEAIGLDIREIRVVGDRSEVQVVYFASFTSTSTRFYFIRENKKWKLKERKQEWIACG
jgi:hypothetical protein